MSPEAQTQHMEWSPALQRASLQPTDEIMGSDIIQRRYRNLIRDYSSWENIPTSPIQPIFMPVEGTLSQKSRFYISFVLY